MFKTKRPAPGTAPRRSRGTRLAGLTLPLLLLLLATSAPRAQEPADLVAPSAGEFAVSSTGAATHVLPVWAPPATAGVAPTLSLAYSSQRGAAHAGQGWALAGLSAIIRCPRTLAQDGEVRGVRYDTRDRFCLDGERLVLRTGAYGRDGAVYRTEVDRYLRVTGYTAGDSGTVRFTVEQPDGMVLEYGASEDSRIEVSGHPEGVVRLWALTRRCDRFGNCIDYGYAEQPDRGEYHPVEVRYVVNDAQGLAARYRVRFHWESRPPSDVRVAWRAGYRTTVDQRLTAVTTEHFDGASWREVRRWQLAYQPAQPLDSGRSRLAWVQEAALGGEHLPAVSFEWQRLAPNLQRYEFSDGADDVASTRVGDFDNDGQQDLYIASSSGRWQVLRTAPGADAFEVVTSSVPVTETQGTFLLDFDGDGRDDLLMPDPGTDHWFAYLADGAQGFSAGIDTGLPVEGPAENVRVADFTGDGLADLLFLGASGSDEALMLAVNTGAAFATPFRAYDALVFNDGTDTATLLRDARLLDFDGDGRQDLLGQLPVLLGQPQWRTAGGCKENAFPLEWTPADAVTWNLETRQDFGEWQDEPGGIGLTEPEYWFASRGGSFYDFRVRGLNPAGQAGPLSPVLSVFIERTCDGPPVAPAQAGENGNDWVVAVAQGEGFAAALQLSDVTAPLPLDMNGDGLTDLAYLSGDRLYSRRSTGAGFTAETSSGYIATLNETMFVTDRNRDGRDDVMLARVAGDLVELWVLLSNGENFEAPLLVSASSLEGFSGSIRDPGRVRAMDLTGNGIADVAIRFSTFNRWQLFADQSQRSDLLTRITDGAGNFHQIDYRPLSQIDGYLADGAMAPVERDYQGALNVVTRVTANDGALTGGSEGTFHLDYAYAHGRFDTRGRGFLGFGEHSVTDSRGLPSRALAYEQSFPFIGRVARATRTQPDGTLIEEVRTDWGTLPVDDHPSGELTWVVWPETVTVDTHGVSRDPTWDGRLLTRAVRRIRPQDVNATSFGQVRRVETVTSSADGSRSFTHNVRSSYHTSRLNGEYCLLPASIDILRGDWSDLPGERRTINYPTPDLATCVANRSVENPDGAAGEVRSAVLSRDRWGNVTDVTLVGEPGTARRIRIDFDAWGQFPTQLLQDPDGIALGQTLTWRYDLAVPATHRQHGLGALETRWTYDGLGRQLSEQPPDGNERTTRWEWCNGAGACALGTATFLVTERRADGTETRTVLDRLTRPLGTWDNDAGDPGELPGYYVAYDARGFVQRATAAPTPYAVTGFPFVTTFERDVLGRPLRIESPVSDDGAVGVETWRYLGLTVEWTDPLGATRQQEVDELGRLKRVTEPLPDDGRLDPAKGSTWYTWTQFDQLRAVKNNALRPMLQMTYDPLGYRRTLSDIDSGTWHFRYNVFGELEEQASPAYAASPTRWRYDAVGRLTRRTEPEGTTTWEYHDSPDAARGQIRAITYPVALAPFGPSRVESFEYDDRGRPLTWRMFQGGAEPLARFDFAYDDVGRLAQLTYPADSREERLQIAYAYDVRSRIETVSRINQEGEVLYAREAGGSIDPFGQVVAAVYGNEVQLMHQTDAAVGAVRELRDVRPGAAEPVQAFRYAWDALGNVTQRRDERFQVLDAASYDFRSRLEADRVRYVADGGGQYTQALALRGNGNVDTKSGVGRYSYRTVPTPAGATQNGQVIGVEQSGALVRSLAWDADGNLASVSWPQEGVTASHEWSSDGKPTTLAVAGAQVALAYGPDRELLVVDRQAADGGRSTSEYFTSLAERSSSAEGATAWKYYVFVDGQRIAQIVERDGVTATEYFHHDALGSVTAVTDERGEVLANYRYDAFGKRRRPTGQQDVNEQLLGRLPGATQFGYTGHEDLAVVGLLHMGGRVYDPALSRVISRDPVVRDASQPESLNGYAYVENNPLTLRDPSGYTADDGPPGFRPWLGSMGSFGDLSYTLSFYNPRPDGIYLSEANAGPQTGALLNNIDALPLTGAVPGAGLPPMSSGSFRYASAVGGGVSGESDVLMAWIGGLLTRFGIASDSASLNRMVSGYVARTASGIGHRRLFSDLYSGKLSEPSAVRARLARVRAIGGVAWALRGGPEGPIARHFGRFGGGLAVAGVVFSGYEWISGQAGLSKVVLVGGIAVGAAFGGPWVAAGATVGALVIGIGELSGDLNINELSLQVDEKFIELLSRP